MKISKWLSLLIAALLPLNTLAVTEGMVEQAPDVDLSTYTEWTIRGTEAYLPDAAMYADRMMTDVQEAAAVTPQSTITPMPFLEPTPMPADAVPQSTTTPMLSPGPSPMPDDVMTGTDTQDAAEWHMVLPTPIPAPGCFEFLLPAGKLFTIGEQDRIRHITVERAKGIIRHPENSDMVVLMPCVVHQTAEAAGDPSDMNNKWSVFRTDGSHVQMYQADAALTVPGDMALCQVNPADFDGESWYLMLPAHELTENDLLAVFDAFDLIGLTFDPSQITIRNCSRGLSYNRTLQAEETERSDRLNRLVYNDLVPGNINTDGNRNLVICSGSDPLFFLRPYSSMSDEELLQEISVNNHDVMEKITERRAREMLNKYFRFPLSMECAGYIGYSDIPVVEGNRKDTQQIILKQARSAMGAEFILSENAGSFIFIDVCFDDIYEGRMTSVKYMNINRTDSEYDAASMYRIETEEKYPELCAAAEIFAKRYLDRFDIDHWYQATGDRLFLTYSILPDKPYMTLYTFTDKALFVLMVEEDGTVREADVHFFDGNADLQTEMAEHPEEYVSVDVP